MSMKISISILLVIGIMGGNAFAQSLVPLDPANVATGHVYLMDNLGGNLPDNSSNGNDGNLVGAPQTVAGLNGEALQFDGVGDGIHLPDAAGINLSTHQNHTVIAVFNCDDVTKSEKQVVYEEGGTTRGLVIYVHEGQIYAGGWNLSDYTPEWTGTYLSAPIGSGEWHAVAAVLRGGTAAQEDDKFEMWLDGELIAKGPGGEFRSRSNDNGIGYHNSETKYHDGNNSTTGDYFGGVIDEVWILNVALGEAELSAIATNRTGAKRPLPANDGTDVPRDGTLSWGAGIYAQTHNVYLGTGFGDVNDASVADPLGVLLSEAQDATSIDPGRRLFHGAGRRGLHGCDPGLCAAFGRSGAGGGAPRRCLGGHGTQSLDLHPARRLGRHRVEPQRVRRRFIRYRRSSHTRSNFVDGEKGCSMPRSNSLMARITWSRVMLRGIAICSLVWG